MKHTATALLFVLAAATGVHRDTTGLGASSFVCATKHGVPRPVGGKKGAAPKCMECSVCLQNRVFLIRRVALTDDFVRSYYVWACSIIGLWSNRRSSNIYSPPRVTTTLRLYKSLSVGSASIGGFGFFRTTYVAGGIPWTL